MNWLLLAGALGMILAAKARAQSRQITFEIRTTTPLSVGEQVFISGNQDVLGNWAADGFPLTRADDNLWTGSVLVPADQTVEFKVTRGTWESEELQEDGWVPGNRVVEPGGDRLVRQDVRKWKDLCPPPPPQITGDCRVHESFHSKYLRFDRRVIVWLPPSYETHAERRYPVIYMQDGQQVFDPQTSTWKQDWEVDEWCTRLIGEERLQEIIVVAVYCTEDRFVEYNAAMAGDQYARFMIEELKPFIDREYRTQPGRATTAVAGSSMGGAISFFLAWTHPEVYGAAACLSPAFRFRDDQFNLDLARQTAHAPATRIFLYGGLGDSTEQDLASGMRDMAELLKQKGLVPGSSLLVVEDPEGRHNEASWASHTGEWLLFLFGK